MYICEFTTKNLGYVLGRGNVLKHEAPGPLQSGVQGQVGESDDNFSSTVGPLDLPIAKQRYLGGAGGLDTSNGHHVITGEFE